ncbi:MAG: hypothetical protein P8Z37_00160 [Acidobacteriota bacterium]
MRVFLSVLLLMFLAAGGYGQTVGMVECNGRTSVSSWEMPDSIIVVAQLECGQQVVVLGDEKGFLRIRVDRNTYAYLKPKYVRILDSTSLPEWSMDENRLQAQIKDKSPAIAEPSEPWWQEEEDIPALQEQTKRDTTLKSGIEIGLDSSYIKYEEPGFMQEKGITLSLYGSYTVRPKRFMFRLEGRMGFAGVDYSSSISGESDRIRDYIVEARTIVGPTFEVRDAWYLTPFSGFGYRYLYDGLGGKTTTEGHMGYNRQSNYLYSPIGIESSSYLMRNWAFVAAVEYDLFWRGWQHSDLGIIVDNEYTAVNEQNDGWGLRWSGKFVKKAGKYNIVFGPYFKYWNIEDSDTIYASFEGIDYSFMEPANTSTEVGGMFGVVF